jgi:hypothetical protein
VTPALRWVRLPVLRAVFAQLAAAIVVAQIDTPAGGASWISTAGQGLLAAAIGATCGLRVWWWPINIALPVAAAGLAAAPIAPAWWAGAFVASALVWWTTFRTQVPLYLSGRDACGVLADLLAQRRTPARFADLGAGTGTVIARLAPEAPQWTLAGFEIAPLPWAIAAWRCRSIANARISRRDFWRESLHDFDVVYAFLSPVPMSALWRKVRDEMRAGSLFVSNTFTVDEAPPPEVIPLARPGRALYVWRI